MRQLQFSIRTVLVSIAFIALALGAFLAVRERLQNRIIVINESQKTIDEIYVQINYDVRGWRNLGPGERVTSTFEPRGDSHFDISWRLADATEFKVEEGYVTSGMHGIRATIAIQADGAVQFKQ
jgi:hypothetical protein